MKKKVVSLVVFIVFLIFTGCNNNVDENPDGLNVVRLKNITSVFVTNPSQTDKPLEENWIKLVTSAREAENSSDTTENQFNSFEDEYIHRTIPFKICILPDTYSSDSRAAENEQKFTEYYVGCMGKTFKNLNVKYNTTGHVQYEGEYCYIWTLDDEPKVSAMNMEEIKTFAENFDSIYEKEILLCGNKYLGGCKNTSVIIPNKKISVLLYDIDGDATDSNKQWRIYGYFQPADYLTNAGSNKMEILYVDSALLKNNSIKSATYSTTAHELNHLLNFVNKTLKAASSEVDYDYLARWYTEMLSMITEDFFMEDLETGFEGSSQVRLLSFITGDSRKGIYNWADDQEHYSTTYAFGAYLARNYGGVELIHEIMTNEYVNEESVVKAVNKINKTNKTFEDLIQEYSLILINTDNSNKNLPSLNIECTGKLTGNKEFTYHLVPIDLAQLPDSKIKSHNINSIPKELGAYGFQFYLFDKPADVTLYIKDGLTYKAY